MFDKAHICGIWCMVCVMIRISFGFAGSWELASWGPFSSTYGVCWTGIFKVVLWWCLAQGVSRFYFSKFPILLFVLSRVFDLLSWFLSCFVLATESYHITFNDDLVL